MTLFLKVMCLLQLWQFWRPSAWADALGLYTRGKRRFAACFPFVAVMFAYTGPRALQQGIRDWHPNEHYWTAARLDLWVLALYLVLALPVTIFWAIRWHAVNGMDVVFAIGDRKKMVQLLAQTLEAGSVLEGYLQNCHAQSQRMSSLKMQPLPDTNRLRKTVPVSTALLSALPSDLPMLAPASMQGQGSKHKEATAALHLHSRIVCNLTARLSMSARLLFGKILSEPWEIVTAFQQ